MAALRAKTDQHGGVPWLEPELSAVYAALAAAPAETESGETLALPPSVQSRLIEIREDIKHGYPDHATYLARLATGWGAETGEQLAARLTDRMRAR